MWLAFPFLDECESTSDLFFYPNKVLWWTPDRETKGLIRITKTNLNQPFNAHECIHIRLECWHSTHSSNGPEQNGPLIQEERGALDPTPAISPWRGFQPAIQWLMRALMGHWGHKKPERKCLPSRSPLFSNKCGTKWSSNTTETMF